MKLAIIPARGGSKRIPGKNIRLFCGKPMIAYSIEAAIDAGCFDHIMVSTDCPEIASVAEQYGAEVPFLRPDNLANDTATIGPVLDHAVKWFQEQGHSVEYVCLLLPTAPLIQAEKILEGFQALESSTAVNAVSVTSMPSPILRSFEITESNRLKMFWPEYYSCRSQDLPEAYYDAGQFSWCHMNREPSSDISFSEDTIPVVIPRYRVQDIDTEEDWTTAEIQYQVVTSSTTQKSV